MGQRTGGDEDATLSKGGGVMMRAARPVYKGTAPRIGRPVTVREGTFWCCVIPENRKVVSLNHRPRQASGPGPRGPVPGAQAQHWFRSPGARARRPARILGRVLTGPGYRRPSGSGFH